MRHIEVDLDVFSAIWARRTHNESNENEVLRRLLIVDEGVDPASSESPLGTPESSLLTAEDEVKTSKDQLKPQPKMEKTMGKIRWVDDIETALRALGGRASLHAIYKAVEKRRRDGDRSIPRTIDAVIRRTLEDHSSDSANFRGKDVFALVGRGEWELR